ncbi:hypothetical protein ACE7GA_00715 [Roseomonas sp. CCTCC AB2023176]|uniref:hypothetical protein n=1 Tax=Roseomonas sp. CCTCC AB2023176 TaxID=3342640 RepID=UPI0035DB9513
MTSGRLLLAVLGYGQVVGWGGTYFMPSILGAAQERDLGLPAGSAFAGITVMLAISGVLSPRVGVLLGRVGPRGPMVVGALLMALGLAIVAAATGAVMLFAGWVVLGVSAPLCLSEPANVALVRAGDARRRITILLLMTGMTSTAAWPALAALDGLVGWRGAVWVMAGLNLVSAGLYLRFVPGGGAGLASGAAVAAVGWNPGLRLVAVGLALGALVSNAVQIHLIALLGAQGLGAAAAVAMASLFGPVQIAARIADLMYGRRFGVFTVATFAAAIMTAGLVFPLLPGGAWTAWPFLVLFALGAGTLTVIRPQVILELAGTARFAALQGRIARWVTLATAVAPSVAAGLLSAGGPAAVLLVCVAVGIGAAWALRAARARRERVA